MKPIILLTTPIDEEKSIKLKYQYIEAIERAGGIPLVIPPIDGRETLDELTDACDGVLFTGGADVSPELYGITGAHATVATEPERDALELSLFAIATEKKLPVMAICRGIQLVNVALGGTLWQDLPTERPTDIPHSQMEPLLSPSHSVIIEDGTPLSALIGGENMTANSFHHQAIRELGRGLLPMAYAPDGLIEGCYLEGYPYLRAYQWHPERLFRSDGANEALFRDFTDECRKYRKMNKAADKKA